ncbi:MAG TPA: DnaJ C-terminal domain-containing protein [Acidimicrobiales bacterium]|nr:DnaJ C-terminal domain-containing protein [Acidimicrobiales bacterium]
MAVRAEWLEKDYYDVLGVPGTASDEELNRAYRRLARRLHPDANPGDPAAEERFKEVTAAYDVLGDPERRREYDEARRLRASGFAGGPGPGDGPGFGGPGFGGPGFGPGGFTFRFEEGDGGGFGFGGFDLGDLLGDVFGGGTAEGGPRPPRPRPGRDLVAELPLTLEEAVRGTTRSVTLAGGDGQAPRTVRARVPAGVDDGQTVRLPGRGEPGGDGGPAGDLLLRVRVEPHRRFGRQGRDVTVTVPVTFPEAALGTVVTVPTLDDPVTLRVPPGTPSGRTFRVRGRGVPAAGGAPAGDLLVTVEVAVPPTLTPEQRRAVEALAAALGDADPRAGLDG